MIKNILKGVRNLFLRETNSRLKNIENKLKESKIRIHLIQESLGRIENRQLANSSSPNINEYEYRVFSQWGEDGIIQYLIKSIDIDKKIFVEFGVEDYLQANTRFLLINNNWSGLIIDGSKENVEKIKNDRIYWLYNLKALDSFVTCENINHILTSNGVSGEIGLLSIDVDGNDYWIWESINSINPVIVVIEYNYRLGSDKSIVIPYKPEFERSLEHHSMLVFGSSLKALCELANQKGYIFVGCCSNGVNAFFVRSDKKTDDIKEISPEDGYFNGQFCEYRNEEGKQVKTSPGQEVDILNSLLLSEQDFSRDS